MGLIYGRYLQFRNLTWPLNQDQKWIKSFSALFKVESHPESVLVAFAKMIPLFLAPKTNQKAPETSPGGARDLKIHGCHFFLVPWWIHLGGMAGWLSHCVGAAKPIDFYHGKHGTWLDNHGKLDDFWCWSLWPTTEKPTEHPNAAGPDKLSMKQCTVDPILWMQWGKHFEINLQWGKDCKPMSGLQIVKIVDRVDSRILKT